MSKFLTAFFTIIVIIFIFYFGVRSPGIKINQTELDQAKIKNKTFSIADAKIENVPIWTPSRDRIDDLYSEAALITAIQPDDVLLNTKSPETASNYSDSSSPTLTCGSGNTEPKYTNDARLYTLPFIEEARGKGVAFADKASAFWRECNADPTSPICNAGRELGVPCLRKLPVYDKSTCLAPVILADGSPPEFADSWCYGDEIIASAAEVGTTPAKYARNLYWECVKDPTSPACAQARRYRVPGVANTPDVASPDKCVWFDPSDVKNYDENGFPSYNYTHCYPIELIESSRVNGWDVPTISRHFWISCAKDADSSACAHGRRLGVPGLPAAADTAPADKCVSESAITAQTFDISATEGNTVDDYGCGGYAEYSFKTGELTRLHPPEYAYSWCYPDRLREWAASTGVSAPIASREFWQYCAIDPEGAPCTQARMLGVPCLPKLPQYSELTATITPSCSNPENDYGIANDLPAGMSLSRLWRYPATLVAEAAKRGTTPWTMSRMYWKYCRDNPLSAACAEARRLGVPCVQTPSVLPDDKCVPSSLELGGTKSSLDSVTPIDSQYTCGTADLATGKPPTYAYSWCYPKSYRDEAAKNGWDIANKAREFWLSCYADTNNDECAKARRIGVPCLPPRPKYDENACVPASFDAAGKPIFTRNTCFSSRLIAEADALGYTPDYLATRYLRDCDANPYGAACSIGRSMNIPGIAQYPDPYTIDKCENIACIDSDTVMPKYAYSWCYSDAFKNATKVRGADIVAEAQRYWSTCRDEPFSRECDAARVMGVPCLPKQPILRDSSTCVTNTTNCAKDADNIPLYDETWCYPQWLHDEAKNSGRSVPSLAKTYATYYNRYPSSEQAERVRLKGLPCVAEPSDTISKTSCGLIKWHDNIMRPNYAETATDYSDTFNTFVGSGSRRILAGKFYDYCVTDPIGAPCRQGKKMLIPCLP
ncbi:MAG TPA: hypothetical protein VI821_00425 [Candidatus Paceibacterota bacterium]